MSLIELGDAAAWSPPDEPVRGNRRRIAAVVVAVLAAALLAADRPAAGAPLFSLRDRVLDAQAAGGMVLVARYEPDGPGRFEARARDGRVLWTRPRLGQNESLSNVAGGVLVLSSAYGNPSARDGTTTALDARTGAQLWQRPASVLIGYAGSSVVLQDVAGVTRPYTRLPSDLPVRLLGVGLATGATTWEQTLPADSLVSYDGSATEPDGLGWIDELTGGTLQRRDPATGAVTTRTSLAGPATDIAGFSVSGDRVLVSRIGRPDDEVYDLASGRLLWRRERPGQGLFPCGASRWCSVDGDGIHGLDAANGRQVWEVLRYNDVFAIDGDRIVAGGLGNSTSLSHEPVVLSIDVRTGAVAHRLTGWIATYFTVPGGRVLVAHTDEGQWEGVVGLYDPRTGGVRVLGRARLGPTPQCRAGEGVVLCLGEGLTVWRLP